MSNITTLGSSFFKQSIAVLPKVAMAIALFIGFYIATKVITWLLVKSLNRLKHDSAVQNLIVKTVQASIILLGLVTALGTAGINVSALVASLGLMSFAIGFAFKDLLTNTLAGALVLIYRPFRIGQTISGSNFEGVVKEINLRYVRLLNDDKDVLIPNATILTSVVTVTKETKA